MSSNKRIRTIFNGINKLFAFPETFEELQAIIGLLYKLAPSDLKIMSLTYVDDEGDNVSVSNTFDLQQAKLFVDKENCNILNMEISLDYERENIYEMDDNNFYDFINKTTQSIKKEYEEELKNLDKQISDLKLNNEDVRQSNNFSEITFSEVKPTQSDSPLRLFKEIIDKKIEETGSEFGKIFKEIAQKKKDKEDKAQRVIRKFILKRPIIKKSYSLKRKRSSHDQKSKEMISEEEEDFECDYEHVEDDNNSNEDFDNKKIQEMVTHLITKKMEEFKQKLMRKTLKKTDKFVKKMLNKKHKSSQELIKHYNYFHRYVSCNGCKAEPIIGIRYKCSVCSNFDYCQNCEEKFKDEHVHPFIKIRKPENYLNIRLNLNQLNCKLEDKKEKLKLEEEMSNLKLQDSPCIQERSKSSNVLIDNYLNKDKILSEDEKSTYFQKLAKNMKILYDLCPVNDLKIQKALEIAKGNMDEALLILFNNGN